MNNIKTISEKIKNEKMYKLIGLLLITLFMTIIFQNISFAKVYMVIDASENATYEIDEAKRYLISFDNYRWTDITEDNVSDKRTVESIDTINTLEVIELEKNEKNTDISDMDAMSELVKKYKDGYESIYAVTKDVTPTNGTITKTWYVSTSGENVVMATISKKYLFLATSLPKNGVVKTQAFSEAYKFMISIMFEDDAEDKADIYKKSTIYDSVEKYNLAVSGCEKEVAETGILKIITDFVNWIVEHVPDDQDPMIYHVKRGLRGENDPIDYTPEEMAAFQKMQLKFDRNIEYYASLISAHITIFLIYCVLFRISTSRMVKSIAAFIYLMTVEVKYMQYKPIDAEIITLIIIAIFCGWIVICKPKKRLINIDQLAANQYDPQMPNPYDTQAQNPYDMQSTNPYGENTDKNDDVFVDPNKRF